MAKEVQFRRGTSAQHFNFVGAEGEVTVDTTFNTLRVHDGETEGGFLIGAVSDGSTTEIKTKSGNTVGTFNNNSNLRIRTLQVQEISVLPGFGTDNKISGVTTVDDRFDVTNKKYVDDLIEDLQQAIEDAVQQTKESLFPIGSIYTNSATEENPSVILGFGTWERFGEGRVIVGQTGADAKFNEAEEVGGSTSSPHTHPFFSRTNYAEGPDFIREGQFVKKGQVIVGAGAAEANESLESLTVAADFQLEEQTRNTNISIVQPYIVAYTWKRTA